MIDMLELTQLDATKCNIVIIHLPENFVEADVDCGWDMVRHLQEFGVVAGLVIPPGWRVEFAEAERKEPGDGC